MSMFTKGTDVGCFGFSRWKINAALFQYDLITGNYLYYYYAFDWKTVSVRDEKSQANQLSIPLEQDCHEILDAL